MLQFRDDFAVVVVVVAVLVGWIDSLIELY